MKAMEITNRELISEMLIGRHELGDLLMEMRLRRGCKGNSIKLELESFIYSSTNLSALQSVKLANIILKK